MRKPIIEACVDSFDSAMIAFQNGADRIELCANLIIGGTTPSPITVKQIKAQTDAKVNVLIRPRFGDFLYSQSEMHLMCEEIKQFKSLGVNGVVIGVLTPEGELDIDAMSRLIACADGINITLHRAFDMTRDPLKSMEQAVELGINTILTSGQQSDAVCGMELLKELYRKADDRIEIMAGAGVRKDNIRKLHEYTGITSFHTSGRAQKTDSKMIYRKKTVSMGLAAISEYERFDLDRSEFKMCADIVHSLKDSEGKA